jgi:hypothetical protein
MMVVWWRFKCGEGGFTDDGGGVMRCSGVIVVFVLLV